MLSPEIAKELEQALHGLQYGSVHLVIHDAKIVRIERVERIRLTAPPEAATTIPGRPTTSTEVRHVACREE